MKKKLIRTIFWQKRINSVLTHNYFPRIGQVVTLDNPQFILYKRDNRYCLSHNHSHVQSFHNKKIAEMVLIELENNWEWKMHWDILTELRDYIRKYVERIEYEI